jgi:hypothetical protein
MAVYKEDDILGYLVSDHGNEVILCTKCFRPDMKPEITQSQLITVQDLKEGDRYFCDECNCEITGP